MKKRTLLPILFSLFGSFIGHASEKIEMPSDYSENIQIKGFETEKYNFDFNKDGVDEKVIVNYKQVGDKIQSTISIYTMEDGKYRFTYQFPFEKPVDIFSLKDTEKVLKKIKENYSEYSKNLEKNEVRYIKFINEEGTNKLSINLKFDKYSPKNTSHFLFIKSDTAIKDTPNSNGNTLISLGYKSRPKVKMEIISENKGLNKKWYSVEYLQEAKKEKNNDNKEAEKKEEKLEPKTIKGFIQASENVLERGFYWDTMQEKIEKVNNFITKTLNDNQELYLITDYVPLAKDFYSKKDKFGNRDNQSVKAYEKSDKTGEQINIPDQTIARVLGEENGMIKVETPMYGTYFIEKKDKVLQKAGLVKEINKFIIIDTNSQTEAIIQRVKNTNNFEVITYSYVTTGKDNGSSSYETPYGAFLVSFTRPYMQFTGTLGKNNADKIPASRKINSKLYVAGDAKWAIRFSGGAYMHGIPASFGEGKQDRKIYTAKKIGTFKESHKCVRHYDDQIGFIVDWVNGGSQLKDGPTMENTIPSEPVAVVVL